MFGKKTENAASAENLENREKSKIKFSLESLSLDDYHFLAEHNFDLNDLIRNKDDFLAQRNSEVAELKDKNKALENKISDLKKEIAEFGNRLIETARDPGSELTRENEALKAVAEKALVTAKNAEQKLSEEKSN